MAFIAPVAKVLANVPLRTVRPCEVRTASSSFARLAVIARASSGGSGGGLEERERTLALWTTRIAAALLAALLVNRGVAVLTPRTLSPSSDAASASLYQTLALEAQSRSDLLGVVACATLLLFGAGRVQLDPRETVAVELEAAQDDVREVHATAATAADDLFWLAGSLRGALPNVRSVLVYAGAHTALRSGAMGRASAVPARPDDDSLLAQCVRTRKRVYAADAGILPAPARAQLEYLPANVQAVLYEPLRDVDGALILGMDRRRALRSEDFGWIRAVADRIEELL